MDQGPERGSDFLERRDSRLPPSSLALSPTPTCRRWPVAPLKTKASAGQGRHRSCSLPPRGKRAEPSRISSCRETEKRRGKNRKEKTLLHGECPWSRGKKALASVRVSHGDTVEVPGEGPLGLPVPGDHRDRARDHPAGGSPPGPQSKGRPAQNLLTAEAWWPGGRPSAREAGPLTAALRGGRSEPERAARRPTCQGSRNRR